MTSSISKTVPMVTTSVPNVFASMAAYPLAQRFFSCPAAAKLLASERFIKPILIEIQNNGPQTKTAWNKDHTARLAKIFIAEEALQTTLSLYHLAFEIFNTQTMSEGLNQQAKAGNVGMDSYARQIENDEMSDTQEHYKLLKECRDHWKLSLEELEYYTLKENQHPEVTLFIQEFGCHTDTYRQRWVDEFQKSYCKKHPSDNRSCNTKKTDLCNTEMVNSMFSKDREAFMKKRICNLLPQAHDAVKNDPSIRKLIQDKCPEALKPSNQPDHEEL